MKLDNRYELRLAIMEILDDNGTEGSVYDSLAEFCEEHTLEDMYDIVYFIYDTREECMPYWNSEFYRTTEEAINVFNLHNKKVETLYTVTAIQNNSANHREFKTVSEIGFYLVNLYDGYIVRNRIETIAEALEPYENITLYDGRIIITRIA